MTDITQDAERLTRIYIKMRDKKEELGRIYKKEEEALKEKMSEVANLMLKLMEATGQEGLKASTGTVSRVVKQKFWTTDWDSMKTFIKENDALELFEQRIAQKNMAQFIHEHPDKLPVGLQIERTYDVLVRRPTVKPATFPTEN